MTVAATNEGADVLDNNESDDATIEVDCPLIVITKTADDEEVTAGDQLGFVVEVTNTGAGSAFDDHGQRRPAGRAGLDDRRRALVGWLDHRQWHADLRAGHAGQQGLDATSTSWPPARPRTAASCRTWLNLTFDGGSGSDDASVTVDCPNITVEKSGNGPIVNGGTATFTITVTNDGPGEAKDVTLSDQLPAGDWTLGGPDKGDCSIDGSNLLTCDFGDVDAPGGEADNVREISVTKTADAGDCGTIPNTVTVGASNEAPEPIRATTPTDATIDVRCPDVDLDKTVDDSSVEPNQTVTYTIHVKVVNGPVTNAVVTDDLPDGQTYTRGLSVPVGAGRQRWRQDPDLDVREPAERRPGRRRSRTT